MGFRILGQCTILVLPYHQLFTKLLLLSMATRRQEWIQYGKEMSLSSLMNRVWVRG